MKKFLVIAFILLSTLAFGKYKDGEYYVESDKSIWFWKPFTMMVVKDGKIVRVQHDRYRKNELASENKGFNKNMKKKTGTNPQEYSKKLPENFFTANGNLEKMDGVAGATDSSRQFKIMMKFLMKKAEEGKPGRYTIEKNKLK